MRECRCEIGGDGTGINFFIATLHRCRIENKVVVGDTAVLGRYIVVVIECGLYLILLAYITGKQAI